MDIRTLQQKMSQFVKERDWEQFHTPKNLAMALSVESSELLEIFQWLTPEESLAVAKDPKAFIHVKEEMADILLYLLRLAEVLDVDLLQATLDKMAKNKEKYPISASKGVATKYTELTL